MCPRVDVARRDAHAELGEKAVPRALDGGVVDVAVQRLLEDALMDLDRVDASRLGAPALPLEVVFERGIVGWYPGGAKRSQKSPADQWPTLKRRSMTFRNSIDAWRSR